MRSFMDYFSDCTLNCNADFCQFADEADCRQYIWCELTPSGYMGKRHICAHGKFFARELSNRTLSCLPADQVSCLSGKSLHSDFPSG